MHWTKDYLYEHRIHNVDIKDLRVSNCSEGIQWAWLYLGECLLHPTHILGYWIGLFTLPLWILGCFKSYYHMYTFPGRRFFIFLSVTLTANVCSLMGTVFTMQIMLLILFGVAAVVIECVALFTAVLIFVYTRKSMDQLQYVEVCNESHEGKGRPLKAASATPWSGVRCIAGCVFLATTVLFILGFTMYSSVGGFAHVSKRDSDDLAEVNDLDDKRNLSRDIMGYVLGCIACVLQWLVAVIGLRLPVNQPLTDAATLNRRPIGGQAMLLIFDLLFVLGILLQSGGMTLALSALPWIVQRPKLDPKRWPYHEFDAEADKDDDETILGDVDPDLPRSSESEESKIEKNVPSLKRGRSQTSFHAFSDQANAPLIQPLVFQTRKRIASLDAPSTTDSELSSQVLDIESTRNLERLVGNNTVRNRAVAGFQKEGKMLGRELWYPRTSR
ncbi:hypothetical protein PoB_001295300 [Plakobranchus ocellatus]|uniref:Transmembrane protein n=1 Tax=Plakobranchus ocellatus TaxID=259542 RepID=A0AAV3YV60_9GAST|nr:hypothetical protein PoB_001295300 [Plakobranchus ocellatus]